ncbi:SusC/RagA family TonB-linked outer membrane protein [Pedobacter sp.]|jgi:TonB-linked SusC/RagA family outer membrane protein|uniref:SusC/RagA family TonB-linked outer membrane protein n=1 Tax=Pedobacter sp. TaxID=1411316 RepID=UPI002CFADC24|nr:SusC/RagA family TonB-linked outer membrane protein [Pedobacter sp.]HWW42993.1 SusC/RagA family TonB-linked outer membrane protein [Pedobacter sp.]
MNLNLHNRYGENRHAFYKFLLVMKITTFFLIITIMQVSAGTFAQKITLNKVNAPLSSIINEIRAQSNYDFFYNKKVLKEAKSLSIHVKDATLEEVLKICLKDQSLEYQITDKTVLIKEKEKKFDLFNPFGLFSEKISGKVVDEKGLPVPGASIVEKGTKNVTHTDGNGDFVMHVKDHAAILVISFVGFQNKEIAAGDVKGGPITLIVSQENLNEVVVTAYGKVKKSSLTDAVATISGENLENRPIRTVTDGLIGLAPGLNIRMSSGAPEINPSINIRGFTSINSSAAPLILVDGVERPIQDVNPNDVESVSLLKDGASTAIYGSRAPYGVILITTKSGKSGKASISYSANTKIGVMVLAPTQPNSPDWARYINIAQRNGQPDGTGTDGVDAITIARMKAWLNKDWSNPAFDDLRTQFGDKAQSYIENGQFPTTNAGFKNWTREQSFATTKLYDTYLNKYDFSQQHNLNFSGGSDKIRYFSSFGYNNTKGLFKGDFNYNRRYNFQTKLDYTATDWLSFRTDVNYVRQVNQGPNYLSGGDTYANYSTIFGSMMQYFATPLKVPSGNQYSWILGAAGILGNGGLINNARNEIVLNGGATLKPFKDFEINADYSRRQSYTEYSRTDKIVYTELPDGTKIQNNRSANVSSITKTDGVQEYQMAKLSAQYKHTFAEKHNLFAQFGMQSEENDYRSLTGSKTDLFAQDLIPALSAAANNPQTSDRLYSWSTLGYYGVITYDYMEKYMVKFAGRGDASSRFAPESRWSFFPSVSGAWNAAKENFWPLKNLISEFKPRVSWSTSGDLASNGADNYYTYISTLAMSVNKNLLLGGGYSNVTTTPGLVSSDLTWAKPTVLNIGIDVSAFKRRLNLSYEWYQRTVKDQVGPVDPLPQVLGTTAPPRNNSVSETRGWELSIGWNDQVQVAQKPLNYSLKFNMSDYIGYVTEYSANKLGVTSGVWTPGEQFGQNYVYDVARIAQNTADLKKGTLPSGYNYPGYIMYKDLNGDGYINSGTGGFWYSRGDLDKDGYSYPRKSYSIMPSVSWNNFSFSAVLEGVLQWRVYNSTEWVWGTKAGSDLAYFYTPAFEESTKLGYWSPDNTNAFFPAFNTGRGSATDRYMLNLANLRIRNVTVGYDLPQSWLKKVKIKRANVYLSGENLGFIYSKSFIKYDPELLSSGVNGYPPLRYYSLGLNINL